MELSDGESPRNPKRRRLNGIVRHDARYSSPDELAASSDQEVSYLRRTSNTTRRDSGDVRQRSYTTTVSEESPDELDHTVHTFYRDNRGRGWESSASTSSEEESLHTARSRPSPERKRYYQDYKPRLTLKGHRGGVAAVKFSPDARCIASCCELFLLRPRNSADPGSLIAADATIRIWESTTGKQLHILEGHLAGISTIAWSPDSKTLASGSDDKSIRLWDISTVSNYHTPH